MFSSKPSAIIVVKRASLTLHAANKDPVRLELPATMLHNLEVVDAKGYKEAVTEFVAKHKLQKKTVLIVLDDSVIFKKTLVPTKSGATQVRQDFENMMPLDPQNRRVLDIQYSQQRHLLGCNVQLYSHLVNILQAMAAKITAVTPIMVFGNIEATAITQQFSNIVAHRRIAQQANFLRLEEQK